MPVATDTVFFMFWPKNGNDEMSHFVRLFPNIWLNAHFEMGNGCAAKWPFLKLVINEVKVRPQSNLGE